MNDPARLSACPLTIHSLLHIAWGIRVAGPVGGYWVYAMERHCNTLLPAVRSRLHPYTAIANCVTAMAQINQIRLLFNVSLDLTPPPITNKNNPPFIHPSCMLFFALSLRFYLFESFTYQTLDIAYPHEKRSQSPNRYKTI